jgi:small multidrug resistance family-3 protein
MNRLTVLTILALAAVLEACGDALVRAGLRSDTNSARAILFPAAAIVLFLYGLIVNAPPWDFGKLLGVYMVFFFVVAQLVSWIFFHQTPTPALWIGGTLIVAGGVVIAASQH